MTYQVKENAMMLRVRLRRTCVALSAAAALGLSLWSCGGADPSGPAPGAPSPLSVSGPTAGASSSLAGTTTTTWTCLTALSAGIFSSASECGTTTGSVRPLGRVAAFATPGPSGNLAGSVSGSTVTLTWLAPTSPDPATSYVVEAGSSPGATNLASFDTGSAATTLTVTAMPPGTHYVRVRAKNTSGTSAPSNEIVLTVAGTAPCSAAPGAPGGLVATTTGSSLMLTWNAPGGACAPTAYVLEAGSSAGASNLANFSTGNPATTFSARGVALGIYFVRVRAANGFSAGGPSNEVIVTVGTSPAPNLSGRWIGVAPDGIIFDPRLDICEAAADLQLDLVQTGTTLTGAITTTTRALARTRCGGRIGEVDTSALTNATAIGTAVSFRTPFATFSGTVSGNRMSGVVMDSTHSVQTGTFAATRQ